MNAFFKYVLTVTAAIFFLPFTPAFGFPWDNASQNEIAWSDNLKQALELSRQSGKPVLLHFFSDTCPPCKMMEKSTFPNPTITEAIKKSFIPVKLNARQYPREAKMFNVQSVPMDIVLSPDGQQIHAAIGGQDPSRYGQFLETAYAASKPYMAKYGKNNQAGVVNISGREVNQKAQQQNQQSDSSPFENELEQNDGSLPPLPEFPAPPTSSPSVDAAQPKIEAGGACPINETPSFDYESIPEEERSKIEFEGCCPVELNQRLMWVRGDYNHRLLFEGRLYFFAGKAQMEEFRQNPEKYAPAFQGVDLVVWKEQRKLVRGYRNYGAWIEAPGMVERVYLFISEENLNKFAKNPHEYIPDNKK